MSATLSGQFYAAAERAFGFLEARGFRRLAEDDRATPVSASVAYVGAHVGFLVTLDIPDQVVDLRVVRVRDGRLVEYGDGGYTCNLFMHLMQRGYRGGPKGSSPPDVAGLSRIERMAVEWANLLRTAGEPVMADREDTLPA